MYQVNMETDWLHRLLTMPPMVILLDAQIALQQGWQILNTLQRHPVIANVPLIVCNLDSNNQHGTFLEMNYQSKPLDAVQVARVLMDKGILADDGTSAKTILIVDDDPGILELHTRLLQNLSARYRVLQAHDGREALATMQQIHPDLVLLDLLMPNLDGFGVLEAMGATNTLRDVPVVILTTQTLTEAEMERLNRGVAAILKKELFSKDEILAHIESTLARTYKLSSATQQLVRKAIAYIHEHYDEPLSRSQIAQYISVNEDYLTDCFHRELGIPPMTYLTRYRISQARVLLEVGYKSVTDIGLAVGFADNAHFSHVFMNEVGVSPNAYRHGNRALA
jgi:YesN/AraC family two-component response regulator